MSNWLVPLDALILFWITLWIGLTVACLALWAAIYHPEPKLLASALPDLDGRSAGSAPIGRPAE